MPRWTEASRARQRELIHQWRPWEKSTGPRTPEGKAIASRNAEKPPDWNAELIQESRQFRFAVGHLINALRKRRLDTMQAEIQARQDS